MLNTRFDWDPDKAESNLRKHDVSFTDAISVFSDPCALIEKDRDMDGELRWHAVGFVRGLLLLTVVHTATEEGKVEVIRIISARKANTRERRRYEAENGLLHN